MKISHRLKVGVFFISYNILSGIWRMFPKGTVIFLTLHVPNVGRNKGQ